MSLLILQPGWVSAGVHDGPLVAFHIAPLGPGSQSIEITYVLLSPYHTQMTLNAMPESTPLVAGRSTSTSIRVIYPIIVFCRF